MSECPICLKDTEAALCHRCVKYLHGKLGEVSVVLDELHTTTIRQSQTAPRNATRGSSERKLPYDERAAAAYDGLVYTLTAWHDRLVSLHQIDPHDGAEATLGKWVAKHVFRIQRDEFAEQGYEQIVGAITEGWRAVDLPPDDEIRVDPQQVAKARDMQLNRQGIRDLCWQMGGEYRAMTKRRIRTLIESGAVEPERTLYVGGEGVELFRLGDVLDAHEHYKVRHRKELA